MARNNKYLWFFGLFAGGSTGVNVGGSPGQWQGDTASLPQELNLDPREVEAMWAQVQSWLLGNIGLIVLIVGLLMLVGLVFAFWSTFCQAGLTVATLRLAQGSSSSFGETWSGGSHYFWRFVGLWLLLAAFGLVVGLIVAGVVALIVLTSVGTGSAWTGVGLALVLGAPFALAALALSLVLSIVVPLAQRAIVDQDLGPVAALRAAWELARRRVVSSLLIWLLAVVLGIMAAIAAGILIVVIAIAAAVILVPLWFIVEASAPFFIALGIAILIMMLVLIAVGGLANAFYWSYWTLSYLQLRTSATAPAATAMAPDANATTPSTNAPNPGP